MLRNFPPITIIVAITAVVLNYAAFSWLTNGMNPFDWPVDIVKSFFTSCATTTVVSILTYMLTYEVVHAIKKRKL